MRRAIGPRIRPWWAKRGCYEGYAACSAPDLDAPHSARPFGGPLSIVLALARRGALNGERGADPLVRSPFSFEAEDGVSWAGVFEGQRATGLAASKHG